jgi:hypothetical protein
MGRADVLFQPDKDDPAHSNLVFFDKFPGELKELTLLYQILGELTVVPVTDLSSIPEAHGGPPIQKNWRDIVANTGTGHPSK